MSFLLQVPLPLSPICHGVGSGWLFVVLLGREKGTMVSNLVRLVALRIYRNRLLGVCQGFSRLGELRWEGLPGMWAAPCRDWGSGMIKKGSRN